MAPNDTKAATAPTTGSTDATPSSGGTAGHLPPLPTPATRGTIGAAGVTGTDPTSYPGIGGDRPGVPLNEHALNLQSGTERADTSLKSDQSDSPKATFIVSSPIEIDGERYEIGDEIELSQKDHATLAHAVRQPSPWEQPRQRPQEEREAAGVARSPAQEQEDREREERERGGGGGTGGGAAGGGV